MAQIDKLITRMRTIPADFRWDELVKVLKHLGFKQQQNSPTGGSRRCFIHHADPSLVISLHEPHPRPVVKRYALRETVKLLIRNELIDDDTKT